MPVCKYCGAPFAWGNADDKWMPLVPVGEEGELSRDYQDENGVLRSSHKQVCTQVGGPAVRVTKLARAVPAEHVFVLPTLKKDMKNRRRKPRSRNS